MTITSLEYLIFITISAGIYYLMPKRYQWFWLLFSSVCFYMAAAVPFTIVYLILAAVIAYMTTRIIEIRREKGKQTFGLALTTISVMILISVWLFFKGEKLWKPVIGILGIHLFEETTISLIAAIGMGYYSAQMIGYILDCYWEIRKPEHNFLKVLLFTGFYPQLTCGPISKYNEFESVFEGHSWSYDAITAGAQRILIGFFKKLVIAENLAYIVNAVWQSPDEYIGFYTWIAFLLYPLLMYSDFSGCLDITLGTAQIYGITLPENFNVPFFSKTNQEFWQRWHITLGRWAKDYVLYPVLKTKWMRKLGKRMQKKLGRRMGNKIPTFLGMFFLWMVMGIWHGEVNYIFGVSIWYWLLLISGDLFEPVFKKMRAKTGFDQNTFSVHLIQSVRTYIIYAIGIVFFRADTLTEAIGFFGRMMQTFTYPNPWIFFNWSLFGTPEGPMTLFVILLSLLMLLIGDSIKYKEGSLRGWIKKQVLPFRWFIWLFLFVLILVYGKYGYGYVPADFVYQGY